MNLYTITCFNHIHETFEIVFDEGGRIPYLSTNKEYTQEYLKQLKSWNDATMYTYELRELKEV